MSARVAVRRCCLHPVATRAAPTRAESFARLTPYRRGSAVLALLEEAARAVPALQTQVFCETISTRVRRRGNLRMTLWVLLSCALSCRVCDEDVCESTLWLSLRGAEDSKLRGGTYEFRVIPDRIELTAMCEVSADALEVSCSGLEGILYAPVYDAPSNPHEAFELHFAGDPPHQLELIVTLDGAVLFNDTLTPDYQHAENYCDPHCQFAMEEVIFPP